MESPDSLTARLAVFAGDIKISHTIFAMPWALLSMILAAHGMADGLTFFKIGLILLCMVSARTAAMSANRLLDAKLDAQNPRTARRAIPSKSLSSRFYLAALALCAITFILSCLGFDLAYHNPWPVLLSPLVVIFVCSYPF